MKLFKIVFSYMLPQIGAVRVTARSEEEAVNNFLQASDDRTIVVNEIEEIGEVSFHETPLKTVFTPVEEQEPGEAPASELAPLIPEPEDTIH